jgi:hypothetical protein
MAVEDILSSLNDIHVRTYIAVPRSHRCLACPRPRPIRAGHPPRRSPPTTHHGVLQRRRQAQDALHDARSYRPGCVSALRRRADPLMASPDAVGGCGVTDPLFFRRPILPPQLAAVLRIVGHVQGARLLRGWKRRRPAGGARSVADHQGDGHTASRVYSLACRCHRVRLRSTVIVEEAHSRPSYDCGRAPSRSDLRLYVARHGSRRLKSRASWRTT